MSNVSDPASLQNLHDIVPPAPPPWWPPAPGWYVVLAVVMVFLLWGLFRALKTWQQNRYRREALGELADIRRIGAAAAGRLPALLKRTALSAWPRDEVASLTGSEWHAFLDRTAMTDRFSTGGGAVLERLSFSTAAAGNGGDDDFGRALEDAAFWLHKHVSPRGIPGD
jgi:hypothetical protein